MLNVLKNILSLEIGIFIKTFMKIHVCYWTMVWECLHQRFRFRVAKLTPKMQQMCYCFKLLEQNTVE